MNKFPLLTIVLLGTFIQLNAQYMLITKRDSSAAEVEVRFYSNMDFTSTEGVTYMFRDLARVILMDYNYARDNEMVVSMQRNKVKVKMAREKDRQTFVPKFQSDSLRIMILDMQLKNTTIKLFNYQKQVKTGTLLCAVGLSVALLAGTGIVKDPSGLQVMGWAGGLTMLTGFCINIDATKHLRINRTAKLIK